MVNEIFLVIGISALATISPGSDFAIVTRNTLCFSQKIGYMTALGVALATWVHTTYCILGIAMIIASSPSLFNFIKIIGAIYLVYLGIKSFFTKIPIGDVLTRQVAKENLFQGLRQGFLSNATNPKTTLFFLSLFTMVIKPDTSWIVQLGYGAIIFILHLLWFSFLCFLMGHPFVNSKIDSIKIYICRGIGCILIGIAMVLFWKINLDFHF